MARSKQTAELLNPVEAYERLAPEFTRLAASRRPYLDRVDQLIISEIPSGKHSLLDVGAGDGRRSTRIAAACGLDRLVLLEPSAGMRGASVRGAETWPIRAEQLSTVQAEFDVIVCLWNVLGHIHPPESRANVMSQFARMAAPDGFVFVDVNHRYNVLEYGLVPTAGRFLHDLIRPNAHNGDVVARWNLANDTYATTGHVFTDWEFRALARRAGLKIRKRFVIDYATGQIRQRSVCGNLLYVLVRT